MEKIERRQKPSIGTRHASPKARVGIMLQRTPKMMQKRPKQMTVQTFKARPLDRKNIKTPISEISFLQTSLSTRSHKIESVKEQEKATKFKARPLNKKILQSKGELGLFSSQKRRTTVPQEFHFATNERIPPPRTVNNAEFYEKIASCLESPKKKLLLRNTIPRPFDFQTDKRGTGKEKLRHHTKHPVRLDTLVRCENELQRDMEETKQLKYEEAKIKILKEEPTPVCEKIRRPLTSVQVYNLHVEQRPNDGTKFDKKFKEKNTAKMVCEENSLKHDTRNVPRFKQSFLSQKYRSSEEVTNSMSPRPDVITRKNRRSKLVVTTATSSAASNMR
ncbi:protein TPX2-like isoform X2 [Rutidosis leptorrhynchoides]